MRTPAFALLLLLISSRFAAAQASPYDQTMRASAALQLAAQRSLQSHGGHPVVADDVLAPRRGKRSEGVTLMIVGGAAVVIGAVAGGGGGAVLIVAGVAAAGYGFYLYSQ